MPTANSQRRLPRTYWKSLDTHASSRASVRVGLTAPLAQELAVADPLAPDGPWAALASPLWIQEEGALGRVEEGVLEEVLVVQRPWVMVVVGGRRRRPCWVKLNGRVAQTLLNGQTSSVFESGRSSEQVVFASG